jgi:hypothetical protein
VRPLGNDEDEEHHDTSNIEEARARLDWLFVFSAARATHLLFGIENDAILMLEQQKQQENILSKMKHVSGDFYRWLQKFEDQIEVCETVGVELTEEIKVMYFMSNLNESIFKDTQGLWRSTFTRGTFPRTFAGLKERIITEFGQKNMDNPYLIAKVSNAGEKPVGKGEVSFPVKEESKHSGGSGCWLCSGSHRYRECDHYDSSLSFDENKRRVAEMLKNTKSNSGGGKSGPRPGAVSASGSGGAGATRASGDGNKAKKSKSDTKHPSASGGVKFETSSKCTCTETAENIFF